MHNKTSFFSGEPTTQKILIYLILLFLSPVLVLPLLYFMYAGFSVAPFLPQDAIAVNYLKKRYGQEFQVIRNASGDSLGSSINYRKLVAPKSDLSKEFNIQKCLARCGHGESKQYTDSYPSVVYEHEIEEDLRSRAQEFGLGPESIVNASVWRTNYKSTDMDIFKPGSTELLSVMDLPRKYNGRVGIGFYINIKTNKKTPTQGDFNRYAETIGRMRDYYSAKGMTVEFNYSVDPGEEAEGSNEKYYRYYLYTYKTPPREDSPAGEKQDTQTISTQFVKKELSTKL